MTICRVTTLAISILTISTLSAQAQQISTKLSSKEFISAEKRTTASYSPTFPRLGLQFGSGLLLGGASAALFGLGGAAVAPNGEGGSGAGFAALGYAAMGGILGYTFGTALGIHTVANSPSYNASYGKILIGTTLGTAAGLGTLAAMESETVGAVAILAAPIVAGMIANNISINKRGATPSALLNISEGDAALSTPSVQLMNVGHININQHRSATVTLLNVSL